MTDQEQFDQEVTRKGKVLLQVLAGLGIFGALLISIIALNNSSERHEAGAEAKPAIARAAATIPAAAARTQLATSPTKVVDVEIVGGAKQGPDGKKHDMFTTTEFAVKAGQPVTLRINNTDDAPHSISSPTAGVNIIAAPGTHTYKLLVAKAGTYQWYCLLPCDSDAGGWAMQHAGYMSGYIKAT